MEEWVSSIWKGKKESKYNSEDDDISITKDLVVYTKAGIEEDLKTAKDQGALEITSEGSQNKSDESKDMEKDMKITFPESILKALMKMII